MRILFVIAVLVFCSGAASAADKCSKAGGCSQTATATVRERIVAKVRSEGSQRQFAPIRNFLSRIRGCR